MPRSVFTVGQGFPARLERFITEKGLTYEQIRRETGIHTDTLRSWRQGIRPPERRLFYRFAMKYGIKDTGFLIKGGEPILVPADPGERRIRQLHESLTIFENAYDRMTTKQLRQVAKRLLDARKQIVAENKRRKDDVKGHKQAIKQAMEDSLKVLRK